MQATVCARLGLKCIVYMGAKDMERQALNVFRMRLMGAEVRPVYYGTATLKDATSEAIRDWVTNVETTHYILGSAAGPHPYPMMVSVRGMSCPTFSKLPPEVVYYACLCMRSVPTLHYFRSIFGVRHGHVSSQLYEAMLISTL